MSTAKEWRQCIRDEQGADDAGRGGMSGIMTIELACLMPVLMLVFQLIIYSTFYYHDKIILIAAAGETVVVAARYERKAGFQGEMDVEEFFRSQVAGKLILFSGMRVEADKTKDEVKITVSAQKGGMSLEVMQCAVISKPEEMIRRMSILKGVLPEGGED